MSKVILVTGASSGLGEAVANYLVTQNYTVYGSSRSIEHLPRPFRAINLDVSDAASVQRAIQLIVQEQGRIDVLINNAGLSLAGPVEDLPIADVERLFNTNVLGILRTTQAVLPFMRQQRSGKIINVSSIAAESGLPFRAAYSASKAAVDRLTEALRLEVAGFGIQACLIQPGGVKTDINKNRMRVTLPAGNVYKEPFDRTYALIDESVSGGLEADVFGPLVKQIIESDRIERLYRMGKPLEKFSVLLKRLLPTKVYERMLRNHYKM